MFLLKAQYDEVNFVMIHNKGGWQHQLSSCRLSSAGPGAFYQTAMAGGLKAHLVSSRNGMLLHTVQAVITYYGRK